jgi:hypothetical protein
MASLNFDRTSYYAFKGTSPRTSNGNKWSRVSNESLDRGCRCHTSIKKDGEEAVCNGLTVRWMDSANAIGEVLPIVQIFEGFSEDIMPKDDCLLLEVPVLSVGSTTDACIQICCFPKTWHFIDVIPHLVQSGGSCTILQTGQKETWRH